MFLAQLKKQTIRFTAENRSTSVIENVEPTSEEFFENMRYARELSEQRLIDLIKEICRQYNLEYDKKLTKNFNSLPPLYATLMGQVNKKRLELKCGYIGDYSPQPKSPGTKAR